MKKSASIGLEALFSFRTITQHISEDRTIRLMVKESDLRWSDQKRLTCPS